MEQPSQPDDWEVGGCHVLGKLGNSILSRTVSKARSICGIVGVRRMKQVVELARILSATNHGSRCTQQPLAWMVIPSSQF